MVTYVGHKGPQTIHCLTRVISGPYSIEARYAWGSRWPASRLGPPRIGPTRGKGGRRQGHQPASEDRAGARARAWSCSIEKQHLMLLQMKKFGPGPWPLFSHLALKARPPAWAARAKTTLVRQGLRAKYPWQQRVQPKMVARNACHARTSCGCRLGLQHRRNDLHGAATPSARREVCPARCGTGSGRLFV